jgi:hypothetical protein
VDDPEESEGEIIAFDDLDAEPALAPGEATPAQLVDLLQTALAGGRGQPPPQPALAEAAARLRQRLTTAAKPHRYLRRAAGWTGDLPADDGDLVVGSAAALLAPCEPSGMPPADEARLATVQAADWLGAVVGLVRGSDGASARPPQLVQAIGGCPEVDGDVATTEVDRLEAAFELILPAWEAAGAVDGDWRLTPLGRWALPRALARAWAGDFDAPSPFEGPSPLEGPSGEAGEG